MLQTGNYIVPEVGGNPYFQKRPLVNWLVAASFRIFGVRNEWTARLPSAVIVLAVAVAFVTVARASLGPGASIIAALIWMTNIGMIEKGRLIEIEALYISLVDSRLFFIELLGALAHLGRHPFSGTWPWQRSNPSHLFYAIVFLAALGKRKNGGSIQLRISPG
jgi:hypothetical protein